MFHGRCNSVIWQMSPLQCCSLLYPLCCTPWKYIASSLRDGWLSLISLMVKWLYIQCCIYNDYINDIHHWELLCMGELSVFLPFVYSIVCLCLYVTHGCFWVLIPCSVICVVTQAVLALAIQRTFRQGCPNPQPCLHLPVFCLFTDFWLIWIEPFISPQNPASICWKNGVRNQDPSHHCVIVCWAAMASGFNFSNGFIEA